MKTLIDRFVEKIAEPFDAHNDCWVWSGWTHRMSAASGKKYGQIWADRRMRPAHRVSYELFVGPVPEHCDVHHSCQDTLCVRPDHLELLSHKDHGGVSNRFGYQTHCKRGHEFTDENTYRYRGGRHCRICHNMRSLNWYRNRKKAS